jgi:hypothetical protein
MRRAQEALPVDGDQEDAVVVVLQIDNSRVQRIGNFVRDLLHAQVVRRGNWRRDLHALGAGLDSRGGGTAGDRA